MFEKCEVYGGVQLQSSLSEDCHVVTFTTRKDKNGVYREEH